MKQAYSWACIYSTKIASLHSDRGRALREELVSNLNSPFDSYVAMDISSYLGVTSRT